MTKATLLSSESFVPDRDDDVIISFRTSFLYSIRLHHVIGSLSRGFFYVIMGGDDSAVYALKVKTFEGKLFKKSFYL